MKKNPTISVLMPVYNAERYVAQAVESILKQTFQDFEFLILDDGSTDKSLKILKKYATKNKQIHLISRPNTGYVVALNEMLRLAKGEFIARMDADDIALPERFSKQVKFLQNNPEAICISGGIEIIDKRGRLLTRLQLPVDDAEIQKNLLVGAGDAISHSAAMIRKSSLIEIGGYDETILYVEDLDLWLKLGEIGKLANLKDFILQYRFHPNSICSLYQQEQKYYAEKVCERAWQRRGIKGYFKATDDIRPKSDTLSRYRWELSYGWWAFNSRQRHTAIIYAIKSIKIFPFQGKGWQLLNYALFKRLPIAKIMSLDITEQ